MRVTFPPIMKMEIVTYIQIHAGDTLLGLKARMLKTWENLMHFDSQRTPSQVKLKDLGDVEITSMSVLCQRISACPNFNVVFYVE